MKNIKYHIWYRRKKDELYYIINNNNGSGLYIIGRGERVVEMIKIGDAIKVKSEYNGIGYAIIFIRNEKQLKNVTSGAFDLMAIYPKEKLRKIEVRINEKF